MAYRYIPRASRRQLIEAAFEDGKRLPLRTIAAKLGVGYNTVRNWLIAYGLYEKLGTNVIDSSKH